MASWLPETLFEIVRQGQAPSKNYYQLLVTRSQASARLGLPSFLTPCPSRLGPVRRAALGREQPCPDGSALCCPGSEQELSLVTSARRTPCSFSPRGRRVPGGPSLPRHRAARALVPPRLPARSVPSARREKRASPLARRLASASEGGKERLSQVSRGGAGRGGGGTVSFPG
jgi:hypothetical protein